jgi:hypothetical protein
VLGRLGAQAVHKAVSSSHDAALSSATDHSEHAPAGKVFEIYSFLDAR